MDFGWTEEQQMLRASARRYLEQRLPPERVAELADSEDGWDPSSWHDMAALGWTGLSVPEEHGGAGMSFLEEAVLFEELARALCPGPYWATVALAHPAANGDPELLTRIATEGLSATLAWAEVEGPLSLTEAHLGGARAEVRGSSWALSGEKVLVPDACCVDEVIVVARSNAGAGLWLIAARDAERSSVSTTDRTRGFGRIRLENAPGRLLVGPQEVTEVLSGVRTKALAAVALEAVGVGGAALELATTYARQRSQFGRPIGSYQAVSHRIADTYVEMELARSLAYWAAWCVGREPDRVAGTAAAAAKAYATEGAVRACERAIQVHGGLGFTWEHPLHRLYRRALWGLAFEATGPQLRASVADVVLDSLEALD
jgi:alkylation response protein AidB-like acyl-CoA dehydrogenase